MNDSNTRAQATGLGEPYCCTNHYGPCHECLNTGHAHDPAARCPAQEAVCDAPDGWDEKTQSPVDEQAESLRYAEPPSADDAVGASESARCNGLCFRASDVGVDVPGDPVAYPNLLCPEHWGEVESNG